MSDDSDAWVIAAIFLVISIAVGIGLGLIAVNALFGV